jgi:hypothetical protein
MVKITRGVKLLDFLESSPSVYQSKDDDADKILGQMANGNENSMFLLYLSFF